MIGPHKQTASQKIKDKSQSLVTVLFMLLLALSVTSLMVLYIDRLPSHIVEGTIATKDIRADQNYEVIDPEATQQLRMEATSTILPVYNFDIHLTEDRKDKISESFGKARAFLTDYFHARPESKALGNEDEVRLRQEFQLSLGLALDDADYKAVRKEQFSTEFQNALAVFLDFTQKRPIILDKLELSLREGRGVVLRFLSADEDGQREEVISDFSHILTLEEAKKQIKDQDVSEIQKKYHLEFTDAEKFKIAKRVVPQLIRVNVSFDKPETDSREERAQRNVQSIVYKLQKGQTIIRRGDRYEKRHLTILNGIRKSRLQSNVILKFLGVFSLVLSTLVITYYFATRTFKRFRPDRKDLNFLGLVLVLFLAILRFGSFLGTNLQDSLPFHVEVAAFYYIIPVAAAAMITRFILNAETAFVFSVVLSFFAGLFLEYNYEITIYYFLSCVAASYLIGGVEKRATVFTRGLYLALINVLLVASLNVITILSASEVIDYQLLLTNCLFAFFGGILCSLTLLAVSPIMEAIFNYTTNIHLLELANMNHPLLREMIVRAPGTYHHSQLVGILAEAGMRAIGGNALLARVGSYYHDIGKMKKPQYFIENQKGYNPHDNLAPSMSALIIEAHVKDGLEMAKEYKLPHVIRQFIPEHQGTKVIGFFYHKAVKDAGDEKHRIEERHYRYAGPKPQSRESGVVMLSDTVESAVRAMPDKSPQKIRAQVEKLVNNHFVDGQLDDCELTLRDLHTIIDAFVKILIGIYHQRVEYPEDGKKVSLSIAGHEQNRTENSDRQSASLHHNISPLFKEKG